MDDDSPVWSINDLADHLNLSLEQVRKALVAGDVPPGHRSGKHVFWYPDEVRAWAERPTPGQRT